MKRTFDIAVAAVGLVLLAPLMLGLAGAIKLASPGPVFYRGVRVGRGGRPFRMFKFRSMVVDADRRGGPSAADGDPRITPIGQFMRRHKLDELPQLLNVLTGDMSLVGPRPEVPFYVDMFTEEERLILSVRPGITDFATLWNPDEGAMLAQSSDPERTYFEQIRPGKIARQLEYVQRKSFATDMKILVMTVAAVLGRRPPETLRG